MPLPVLAIFSQMPGASAGCLVSHLRHAAADSKGTIGRPCFSSIDPAPYSGFCVTKSLFHRAHRLPGGIHSTHTAHAALSVVDAGEAARRGENGDGEHVSPRAHIQRRGGASD